jgi:hypothetical protein
MKKNKTNFLGIIIAAAIFIPAFAACASLKDILGALGDAGTAAGGAVPMKGPANPTPSATLADYSGTYYIAAGNGMVMDVKRNAESVPHQSPFNNTRTQQFRFEKQSDGSYKITSVATGKLLTSFWWWAVNGKKSAMIQLDDYGNRQFSNPHNRSWVNLLIGLAGLSTPTSEEVHDINQRWSIESVGNGEVKIESANDLNGCMDFGATGSGYHNVNGYVLMNPPVAIDMKGTGFENLLSQRLTLIPASGSLDRLVPLANGVYRVQSRFTSETGNGRLYGNRRRPDSEQPADCL